MSTSIYHLNQNFSMYLFLIPYEKTKDLSYTNAGNDMVSLSLHVVVFTRVKNC